MLSKHMYFLYILVAVRANVSNVTCRHRAHILGDHQYLQPIIVTDDERCGPARFEVHRLVLLAPASPTAPTAIVVATLSLVPLVALGLAPWVAASLRTSLTTSLCSSLRTSLRAGLCTGLRTGSRNAGRTSGGSNACALAVASSRNAGAVARLRSGASGGAVLRSGVCRGGGT